jgi:hypothetical protein
MTRPPWVLLRPGVTPENLGILPEFLDEDDPDGARAQLDKNYAHGGGYYPSVGFTLSPDRLTLTYPGDPPFRMMAACRLRDEIVALFEHEMVAVIQLDGSFVVARMN